MQHKFCLVDEQILMTGTLNWGDDRSSDNWNYVYITSKPQLVEPVKTEFSHMWNSGMNIEEAIRIEPVLYESDDASNEIKTEEINNETEVLNNPLQISMHRETQITPELCLV